MAARPRPRVLVVDDGVANRKLLEAYLAAVDCDVDTAEDGASALEAVREGGPDLVLLDVQMPGMDGLDACRQIKADPATRLLPVVMVTALDRSEDRVQALEAGADDFMSKPVDRLELIARTRSALRLKAVYDSLESAEGVIFSLAAAIEAKDSYTEAHTERVADTARELGARLGLGAEEQLTLYRGGLIHDIGKIGVPDSVLLKPGPLDAAEQRLMQQHPVIGERIATPLRSAAGALQVIRHHHERWDGAGYPDGLAGADIPLLARVVAVCDAYDALVSDRPYRRGRSHDDALKALAAGAGTQWDPSVVTEFIASFGPAAEAV